MKGKSVILLISIALFVFMVMGCNLFSRSTYEVSFPDHQYAGEVYYGEHFSFTFEKATTTRAGGAITYEVIWYTGSFRPDNFTDFRFSIDTDTRTLSGYALNEYEIKVDEKIELFGSRIYVARNDDGEVISQVIATIRATNARNVYADTHIFLTVL